MRDLMGFQMLMTTWLTDLSATARLSYELHLQDGGYGLLVS